jgi:hypothetical protein
MALKKDISQILAEAKQVTKDLMGHKSDKGLEGRLLILCGLLGEIKIPVERQAEVVEAIGEIQVAVSDIVSKKFFEDVIEKIRS